MIRDTVDSSGGATPLEPAEVEGLKFRHVATRGSHCKWLKEPLLLAGVVTFDEQPEKWMIYLN